MVKPANTPPAKTRAMATPKYSHRLASSGDLGRSSSCSAWMMPPKGVGRALTRGAKAWNRPRRTMLTRGDKPLPGRERAELMAEAIAMGQVWHLGAVDGEGSGCAAQTGCW